MDQKRSNDGQARDVSQEERKGLKILHLVFVATIPLFFISGHIARGTISKWWLYVPFALLLFDIVRSPHWIRELQRSRAVLAETPHDRKAFITYKFFSICFFVTGETLAVAGWVSQMFWRPPVIYTSFYLAGVLVLCLFTPRAVYRSSH